MNRWERAAWLAWVAFALAVASFALAVASLAANSDSADDPVRVELIDPATVEK